MSVNHPLPKKLFHDDPPRGVFVRSWLGFALVFVLWVIVWWLQMGPLRPLFNVAPGVELPFFPAGIRTLAVFVFGFSGALGIFAGSLTTYFWFFPELVSVSLVGVVGAAAASAFSAYFTMRVVCHLVNIPFSLGGLTLRNITLIVATQGLLSASVHQAIYAIEGIGPCHAPGSSYAYAWAWSAMAAGDIIGAMLVLFSVRLGFMALQGLRRFY